ncbi:uncharacterized protein N7479_001712 [Penicillium vulpinum]|uniref:uncharacterized protein n=1 Tax=Penicillium vulpinum TaxID=29845 RepID=UPI0025489636|nr:uncharacterized protein N7479_001712 [Penicillium vulpinum]KAJ5971794.1 hypothetical protein N7479_001712 [Penicillium vulpinum]
MYGRFRARSVREQPEASSRVSASSSRTGKSSSVTSVDTETRLRHRWVFLTYSRCSLESKDEFEEHFSGMLQRNHVTMGATYYGCRENHETEGLRYHVLVRLEKQPNWSCEFMKSAFSLEGVVYDWFGISISPSRAEVPIFIEKCVYSMEMSEAGDCFGQRPILSVERWKLRQRVFDEGRVAGLEEVSSGDCSNDVESRHHGPVVSSYDKMRVSFVVQDV